MLITEFDQAHKLAELCALSRKAYVEQVKDFRAISGWDMGSSLKMIQLHTKSNARSVAHYRQDVYDLIKKAVPHVAAA